MGMWEFGPHKIWLRDHCRMVKFRSQPSVGEFHALIQCWDELAAGCLQQRWCFIHLLGTTSTEREWCKRERMQPSPSPELFSRPVLESCEPLICHIFSHRHGTDSVVSGNCSSSCEDVCAQKTPSSKLFCMSKLRLYSWSVPPFCNWMSELDPRHIGTLWISCCDLYIKNVFVKCLLLLIQIIT